MGSKRTKRVAQLLKEELSRIIREDLEDPNLGFITITHIDVSKDLKHALVLVSVFGDEEEKDESIKAVLRAKGLIKKIIAENLPLRFVPELKFKLDKSLEYSTYIDEKINQIRKEDEQK